MVFQQSSCCASIDTSNRWGYFIEPNEVLIKLNVTGICHSDIHFMMNDWALLPKMSTLGTKCAGHEGAGVIVKVGDAVKNLKVGMRAGFKVSSTEKTLSLRFILIFF